MDEKGKVYRLFTAQKDINKTIEKACVNVDLDGIIGDKHHGTSLERSVLITSLDSYRLVWQDLSVQMPYGYLGENILIDYNPYHLKAGERLQIGNAIFEITQNCTLCNHLSALDKRIPKLLKNDRGIFAKVVAAGEVKRGDTVCSL